MKTITKKKNNLKMMLAIAALCLGLNASTIAQCSASYTYTLGSSGIVYFTNTSTVTTGTPTYNWYFSDGTSSTSASPTDTFLYNGTYNVSLYINTGSCADSVSQNITVTNATPCNLAVNFTYSVGSSGQINFTNTSTNIPTSPMYAWFFGDNAQSNLASPSHTYAYNGTYVVELDVYNANLSCSSTTTQTISITNTSTPPTACNASFTYATSNSSIVATSTSTGTTSTTAYNWGLANYISTNPQVGFTSLYNGTYTVTLSISDSSSGCASSSTQTIAISGGMNPPPCVASFSYSIGTAGQITCVDTSPVDSLNNTGGSWSFNGAYVLYSDTVIFPCYYNGTYTVTLNNFNNIDGCYTSSTQTITVTNANPAAACNANFTYTLGATGQTSFTSLYTGTAPNVSYYWDFGNGGYSVLQNPSYTYPYNGIYSVALYVTDSANNNCSSSTTQTLSITNTANQPCAPTVSFYMINQDSIAPSTWGIVPNYSSQISNALWYWGDGSSTWGLYPSHTYASAGEYTICVMAYSTCGDSSYACQNDSLFRWAHPNSTNNSMIQVNVLNTTAGIKINTQETAQLSFYPNPSAGLFTLQLNNVSANASKAQINISNVLGEVIYTSQEQINNNGLSKEIDLQSVANGAYFMKVSIGDKTFTNKTIINK